MVFVLVQLTFYSLSFLLFCFVFFQYIVQLYASHTHLMNVYCHFILYA